MHDNDIELQALLAEAADESERGILIRAWAATACLEEKEADTPPMSPALASVLRSSVSDAVDEPLSDDELEMVAAAGSPLIRSDDDDPLR